MNIRIYQVNTDRDANNIVFTGYENLLKYQGSLDIDSSIYDKVFEGEVSCKNLNDVWEMFNINHPQGYKARSLSKSDVVEMITEDGTSEFHYVDTFGFKKVDFAPDKCEISDRFLHLASEEKISVLLVQPGKYPKTVQIKDTLEEMQRLVGGDIEEYMPFEDEVAIICNDEGKINGMSLNRAVYDSDHQMMDIMAGDFFICHAPISSEKFLSLPPDLEKKYSEKFRYPEKFVRTDDGIKAIPYKPTARDMER